MFTDNITTVANGCGVQVCYNIHTPNTPTTLQEFRIHRSLCGKMSEVDMVSYPITKDHCVQMKNLLPETCYSLRYEGRVRIGEMGVPSDMSTATQVKTEQCEEPEGDYFCSLNVCMSCQFIHKICNNRLL